MDLDRLEEVEDVGPDWSVSRLQTIMACGKKYEYKYINRIEEPPTPALAFGSAIHRCIETMHLLNRWDDTYMQRLWSDIWFESQLGIDWDSVRDRKSNKDKKGLEILEKYKETNQDDEWLALESHFRFNPAPFLKGTPMLRGTFDKIMYLRGLEGDLEKYNGRLAVIDYKTSKNPPSPLLLRVDPQLTIYHQAAKNMLGEEVVVVIHHLLTNTLHPSVRTDKDIEAVLLMIADGMDRIETGRLDRNISYACNWCPFKQDCLTRLVNES